MIGHHYLGAIVLLWVQLAKSLTSCDILLGILAAATHDLDHPGVNQPFLIKTDHYLATLYRVKPHNSRCSLAELAVLYWKTSCDL